MKYTTSTLNSFTLFLALCLFLLPSFSWASKSWTNEEIIQPSLDNVKKAINSSTKYLTAQTKKSGKFIYRINMNPAIQVKESYNILRHAGSIYAMSHSYQLKPDAKILSAIERATHYLRKESVKPLSDTDNNNKDNKKLAIWSVPETNKRSSMLQAKLGGTGLGLVALLSMEKIKPDFTPLTELQALGRFLVYMQKEDGSFYSKYIPAENKDGRDNTWTSLYYPGEAALGLLMLYEKDPTEQWINTAAKALEYLAKERKNAKKVPRDHWALLATEKILSIKGEHELNDKSKDLLIHHAIQISESILRKQINHAEKLKFDGRFTKNGKTTSSATNLEGLLAMLSILPPEHRLYKRIDNSVKRGISFLLNAQIQEGEFAGAMPRAVKEMKGTSSKAKRFNARVSEVRIDYVQHSLSALLQFYELKKTSI